LWALGNWTPKTLSYEHGRRGRRAICVVEPKGKDELLFTFDADDADGKPIPTAGHWMDAISLSPVTMSRWS
jgi:hypothetical protein